jgi:hypothetical protein
MDLKLKVVTSFPTSILEGGGVRLDKNSGKWTFSLDYSQYPKNPFYVKGPQNHVLVFRPSNNNYFLANPPFLISSIVTTPTPLIVSAGAPIGTVVGTLSVVNGVGSYTFSLTSNPGGKYQIVGNQLQVAAPLTAGTDTITILADNGAGSTPTLTTPITVTAVHVGYVPTYYLYGF